jgi:hypothetical protein
MRFSQYELLNALQGTEPEAAFAGRYIRTKLDFSEQSIILDNLPEDTSNIKQCLNRM